MNHGHAPYPLSNSLILSAWAHRRSSAAAASALAVAMSVRCGSLPSNREAQRIPRHWAPVPPAPAPAATAWLAVNGQICTARLLRQSASSWATIFRSASRAARHGIVQRRRQRDRPLVGPRGLDGQRLGRRPGRIHRPPSDGRARDWFPAGLSESAPPSPAPWRQPARCPGLSAGVSPRFRERAPP